MHEIPLLLNITIGLVVAYFGGILAKKIGLPTIVGYLLGGIVIGPFTPGFVGDTDTIQQLAELGVIFLMFGVGLEFSVKQLWRVKNIAIPGALIQTAIATLAGVGLSQLWGWNLISGIVLGLSISVASTVVLLRGLIDNKLLNTNHGQAAVGWLVMEDILSVLILVLMPLLVKNNGAFQWGPLLITLLKAIAFIVIMFFFGNRLIPWILERTAHTHSRELFILAELAITLGTALGAAELFGISLALGAFVAGAIISQSHLSHQVGADVFAFREAFSVLFFVSVGMLVNPLFLWQNIGQVAALSALVIFGKFAIVLLMALFFPQPIRTFVVIAIGLSQVGEFSFILGQGGLSLNLLTPNQYSLILAAALISITVNPLMYKLRIPLEKLLQKLPVFTNKFRPQQDVSEVGEMSLKDHVIIVGYDRVGKHMVDVLHSLQIPLLVIEDDVERIDALTHRGVPTLFGDASNSEVINHANLGNARVLVSTIPDETSTALIVTKARDLAPDLTIVARSATEEGVENLHKYGADYIVQPELEGGLELLHHTLLELGFPLREVHEYAQTVRNDHYNLEVNSGAEHRSLNDLLRAYESIEITWYTLYPGSPIEGLTLANAAIRSKTGSSVVAIIRAGKLFPNPKSSTVFESEDRIGVIGEKDQLEEVRRLISVPEDSDQENNS